MRKSPSLRLLVCDDRNGSHLLAFATAVGLDHKKPRAVIDTSQVREALLAAAGRRCQN
jgi:hypothetical protein